MRHFGWRAVVFVAERVRMIFLALALLAMAKVVAGAILDRFDPQKPNEPGAMAQP